MSGHVRSPVLAAILSIAFAVPGAGQQARGAASAGSQRHRRVRWPTAFATTSARTAEPEKRAELRLAVNAGSVLEDDDQRGLAHFVEHMAFNGTKRFPKQELVDFLESHRHAVRRRPQRVHELRRDRLQLQVPTDKPEHRRQGVRHPRGLGARHDVRLRRRSRRSAASSSRSGGSAAARTRACCDKQFPVLFKGSRYAERLPIGRPEIIETFAARRAASASTRTGTART